MDKSSEIHPLDAIETLEKYFKNTPVIKNIKEIKRQYKKKEKQRTYKKTNFNPITREQIKKEYHKLYLALTNNNN